MESLLPLLFVLLRLNIETLKKIINVPPIKNIISVPKLTSFLCKCITTLLASLS